MDRQKERAGEGGAPAHRGSRRRDADRAVELERLETLSRRAAAASTPDELFRTVVTALLEVEDLDAILVASRVDGPVEATAHLARSVDRTCIDVLARRAGEALGCATPDVTVAELDELDNGVPARAELDERDIALLPVERAGRRLAVLVVLPTREGGESALRLLYAAANQTTLHLDRILSARDAEQRRLGAVLESMPQAVVVLDARLAPLRANRAAHALVDRLGLPGRDDWARVIERLGLRSTVDSVRSGRAAHGFAEVEIPGQYALAVTVSPLTGEREAGGIVLVLVDRSESRRLERRLAHSEKMSSLGQLISGTAHELNNPLASVVGYAQLLAASPVAADPEVARRLAVLRRDAERCRRIVQNLLAFARKRPPERRPVSINEVVTTTVALVEYALRAEGVAVVVKLDRELPAISGDAHELQAALLNLITNARDAMTEHGPGGTIEIRSATDGSDVVIDVADSGPGVPAELAPRVFDPFFTTKPEGRGTGLGLAIVYGAVTSHGGSVELVADAGPGATFRIRLPRGTAKTRAAESPTEAASRAVLRGRVLVVDDEPSVARMVADALEADGHTVECVGDGGAALVRLREARFDAILADLRMPELDGPALIEAIRRDHPRLASSILLATGDTVSGRAERAAADLGVELLEKPFDLDRLRASVRRCVSGPRG